MTSASTFNALASNFANIPAFKITPKIDTITVCPIVRTNVLNDVATPIFSGSTVLCAVTVVVVIVIPKPTPKTEDTTKKSQNGTAIGITTKKMAPTNRIDNPIVKTFFIAYFSMKLLAINDPAIQSNDIGAKTKPPIPALFPKTPCIHIGM